MTTIATIKNDKARHSYDVEVGDGRMDGYVTVEANSRDQAARIAERAGYVVRSVNMIG